MPEISEQQLQELKETKDALEEEKAKVSALTSEKEELNTKLENKTKEFNDLVLENTRLRNLNGKLLLQKETSIDNDEEETEKSLEDQVLEILKQGENK